jgi:hypothetical protein
MAMKRWWVRWYGAAPESFEYHGPWWISGWGGSDLDTPIHVAAVCAETQRRAELVIEQAYDRPGGVLDWSFANERSDDWEPFCDRFPRAEWMKWPYPQESR